MATSEQAWVADCTLPTVQQPLRLAEFDHLFSTALLGQRRLGPTRLRWELDPAAAQTARDLARRESACCSFFTFTFAPAGDVVTVDVSVPAGRVDVLDALHDRAAAGLAKPRTKR